MQHFILSSVELVYYIQLLAKNLNTISYTHAVNITAAKEIMLIDRCILHVDTVFFRDAITTLLQRAFNTLSKQLRDVLFWGNIKTGGNILVWKIKKISGNFLNCPRNVPEIHTVVYLIADYGSSVVFSCALSYTKRSSKHFTPPPPTFRCRALCNTVSY